MECSYCGKVEEKEKVSLMDEDLIVKHRSLCSSESNDENTVTS